MSTARLGEELQIQPLLTADEVARILNVPRKTVLNLSRRGDFVRLKIGDRTVRFDPADILQYLQNTKAAGQVEENGNGSAGGE